MDIDTDREYRIQQLEEFILNHESELSVDGLLVSDDCCVFLEQFYKFVIITNWAKMLFWMICVNGL